MRTLGVLVCVLGLGVSLAPAQDFWGQWGDGKAEISGYRLTQPRDGKARSGRAVLVFLTENMSDASRVKVDAAPQPGADVFPVMRLNDLRDFRSGIDPYHLMTSVFARVQSDWPLAKASFSSQDWSGHGYRQLLPRAGALEEVHHGYVEGDGRDTLPLPPDGLCADVLPILVRGLKGEYLRPGEARSVPFLPRLLDAERLHKPPVWGRATIARAAEAVLVRVPAGRINSWRWTVSVDDGTTLTFDVEDAAPHRIVRWAVSDGEEGQLTGTARLAYWKADQSLSRSQLKALGF